MLGGGLLPVRVSIGVTTGPGIPLLFSYQVISYKLHGNLKDIYVCKLMLREKDGNFR
jgi:hypothetical protein